MHKSHLILFIIRYYVSLGILGTKINVNFNVEIYLDLMNLGVIIKEGNQTLL